jgi:hypothetical protein
MAMAMATVTNFDIAGEFLLTVSNNLSGFTGI